MSSPVVMIHGYDYDPFDPNNSPFANDGAFTAWTKHLDGKKIVPLPWYSARAVKDIFRAWMAGHLTTYSWAYLDLVEPAVDKLLNIKAPRLPDVICHSLGSRVILRALEERPNSFRRVIFLNGAETVKAATPIIRNSPWTQFLNISVSTDDVLKRLGAWFEPEFGKHALIGYRGIGASAGLENLTEVQLDDKGTQQFYRRQYGWDLRGDNPDSIGDHRFSYLHEGNWPLYRTFLRQGWV